MKYRIDVRRISRALFPVFGLLFLVLSRAGTQAPSPLPPSFASITALTGEFKGKAKMTMDGKTVEFTLHPSNSRIADGRGLQCSEKAEIPGMGPNAGTNLSGYDPGEEMLHIFSVTSDDSTHDHKGRFDGKSTMLVYYEGRAEVGQPFHESIPPSIMSKKEYSITSEVKIGGAVVAVFEASMKRVKYAGAGTPRFAVHSPNACARSCRPRAGVRFESPSSYYTV